MSDVTADSDGEQGLSAPARSRRGKGLILWLLLALASAGGGFWAAWSGQIHLPAILTGGSEGAAGSPALPAISYVPVPTIVISLGPGATGRHLKFTAQLETESRAAAEVTLVMPRILDVLNSYLRAVDPALLEDPGALSRLRGQMLRRVQIVTGEAQVRDLLIAEFVLN